MILYKHLLPCEALHLRAQPNYPFRALTQGTNQVLVEGSQLSVSNVQLIGKENLDVHT